MQAATFSRLLSVLIMVALITACGQTPDRPSRPPGDSAEIARADSLIASGQYLAAAEIYRQLAARTPPGQQRAAYLLDAAEASRTGSDWDGVRSALTALATLNLSDSQTLQRRLLQAEVLLQ